MAKICPKCSAETVPLEEETSSELCIHEKLAITGVTVLALAGALVGTGIL